MIIPDAAVSFVLQTVTNVLTYNCHLIADVRENILSLQKELLTLRAAMKDFIMYNDDNNYVEDTVNQIRTIIGQAEDAVDSYLLQVAMQSSRDRLSQVFHKYTDYPKVLRDVGKQIEIIGEQVKEINEKNLKNGLKFPQYQATAGINRPQNSKEVLPP